MLLGCGPNAKEKNAIEGLTSKMKTVCMGRLMMDVPGDMKVDGDVKLFYGLGVNSKTVEASIESPDSTTAAMKAMVDAEAAKIDKDIKNWATKKSMLLEYRVIDDHTIYLRKQDSFESAVASNHELHVLAGKTQVVLSADSYEGVSGAGHYESDGKVETPEQVAARLFKVAREIRTYDAPEKAGPGYCLGPVVIDSNQDEEQGSTYMAIDRYPDLRLSVYSMGFTPDPPSELEKVAAAYPQIHIFRNRDTTMGGMKAHEWLARIVDHQDHDDIVQLGFVARSMRPSPALIRPYVNVKLDTGGQLRRGPNAGTYVSSSLTPKEATALWDTMISSVRVRPNAMRLTGNGSGTSH
jgi:hypothetical protein